MTGKGKSARRESRRVVAAKKKAARVRDELTLNQAMACIHRKRWLEVICMLDEVSSLSEYGVFELCELPSGQKSIWLEWVLNIKRGAQGEIEHFKAHVIKGFEQIYGIAFFETCVLAGGYATLCALLSVCAVWDLETIHIDIKCAFLNGVLKQVVYIVQPHMFHDVSRRVWRFKKGL